MRGQFDLPVISDAWTVRDGDLAIVRCNRSRQVFHLKCNGNVWFGDLTNCTSGASYVTLHLLRVVVVDLLYNTLYNKLYDKCTQVVQQVRRKS